jgi:hypothetical protein
MTPNDIKDHTPRLAVPRPRNVSRRMPLRAGMICRGSRHEPRDLRPISPEASRRMSFLPSRFWWTNVRMRSDPINPAERALHAQIASCHRWAMCPDRSAATAPGRRALADKDDRTVDPDGTLAPDERARRTALLRRERASRAALARWHARPSKKRAA